MEVNGDMNIVPWQEIKLLFSLLFPLYCLLITRQNNSRLVQIQSNRRQLINPFPHDKILDQTTLKAFADDKLNVTKMVISVFDRVENIVGKGEIACTSNFSFSHNVFKRLLSQKRQKVSLCGKSGMG